MLTPEERAKKRAEIEARVNAARALERERLAAAKPMESRQPKQTENSLRPLNCASPNASSSFADPYSKSSGKDLQTLTAVEQNQDFVTTNALVAAKNLEISNAHTSVLSNLFAQMASSGVEENEEDEAESLALCNRLVTAQDPDELDEFLMTVGDKARAIVNVTMGQGPGNPEWEWRMDQVIRSIHRGDLASLRKFAENDPSLLHMPFDIPGLNAGTCGHLACNLGHLDVVKYIHSGWPENFRRPDVNFGNRAIHGAAAHGQVEVLQFLLEYEPRGFMSTNKRGQTPRDVAKGAAKAFFKKLSKAELDARIHEFYARRLEEVAAVGKSPEEMLALSLGNGGNLSVLSFMRALTESGFANLCCQQPDQSALSDVIAKTAMPQSFERIPAISFTGPGPDGTFITGMFPRDAGQRVSARLADEGAFPQRGAIVRTKDIKAMVGEVVEIVPPLAELGRCGIRTAVLQAAGKKVQEEGDWCAWQICAMPQGLWEVSSGKTLGPGEERFVVRAREQAVYVLSFVSAGQIGAVGAYTADQLELAGGSVAVAESEEELLTWSMDEVIDLLRTRGIWTKQCTSKHELISRLFYFAADNVD